MDFQVVIPARYASTRLPGKPLLLIGDKPMVVRVAEQAQKSGAKQICIATDHTLIMAEAQKYGFTACLTDPNHASGTDRIAEVVQQFGWSDDTIVVNVQGDEPLIPPDLIQAVAHHLHEHPECAISTACHPIHDLIAIQNPNVVKVVLDKNGNALYFSRAPIPWPRDGYATEFASPSDSVVTTASSSKKLTVLRHIGIYAYRAGFLRTFKHLAQADIEQIEYLEQLRVLWHGYRIGVTIAQQAPPAGVDNAEDLQIARALFTQPTKEQT